MRAADTLTVTDPAADQPVVCHRLAVPVTATDADSRFTTVAIRFPRSITDDEAEVAAGLFGYAWAQHGAARRTGSVDDYPVVWHDPRTMVVTAPMILRPERSRTRAEATADLFRDFLTYLTEGSPVRRDGTRLVPALDVDVTRVELFVSP